MIVLRVLDVALDERHVLDSETCSSGTILP